MTKNLRPRIFRSPSFIDNSAGRHPLKVTVMPKASKAAFYAVHIGHRPGVYASWVDCEQQIKGYPKSQYKKFSTESEAKAFVESGFASGTTAAAAVVKSSASQRPSSAAPLPVDKTTYMTKKLGKQSARESDVADESEWDVVFTDGACQGNGQVGAVAGIGVWWGVNDSRNLVERCPGDQTNNRAELIAIIRALETNPNIAKPFLIKTDSSYSISCIRDWISAWRKRGWKTADGKDVKNKSVIMYLSKLLDRRGQCGQTVRLQHVAGHAGIVGNEGADVLAGLGTLKPALPERNWTLVEEEDTKDVVKDAIADFLLEEGDLLSEEELRRIELEGFD